MQLSRCEGYRPRPTSRTGYLLLSKLVPGGTWVVPLERLVDCSGLEPPTSRVSGVRSNRLSYEPKAFLSSHGGDERDRTADLLLARQALSQLS